VTKAKWTLLVLIVLMAITLSYTLIKVNRAVSDESALEVTGKMMLLNLSKDKHIKLSSQSYLVESKTDRESIGIIETNENLVFKDQIGSGLFFTNREGDLVRYESYRVTRNHLILRPLADSQSK